MKETRKENVTIERKSSDTIVLDLTKNDPINLQIKLPQNIIQEQIVNTGRCAYDLNDDALTLRFDLTRETSKRRLQRNSFILHCENYSDLRVNNLISS